MRLIIREETEASIDKKLTDLGVGPAQLIFLSDLYRRSETDKEETKKMVRKIAMPLAVSAVLALLNIDAIRSFLEKHF